MSSIPVPPTHGEFNDVKPAPGQEEAWRKAQEALNKVAATKPQNKGNQQAQWNYPHAMNSGAVGTSFGAPIFSQFVQSNQPPPPPPPPPQAQYNRYNNNGGYQQNRYQNGPAANFVPGSNQKYQQMPYNYGQNGAATGQKPFQGFSIGRGTRGGRGGSFQPINFQQSRAQQQYDQGPVLSYIQRAFEAANTPEDRKKTEEYISARVKPMMDSGMARMVNWSKEPLPHERNFVLPPGCSPVKQPPAQPPRFQQARGGGGAGRPYDDSPAKKRYRPGFDDDEDSRDSSAAVESGYKSKESKKKQKAEKKKIKKQQQQRDQIKEKWREPESMTKREERAKRFAETVKDISSTPLRAPVVRGKITEGYCTDIEKSYFRLTSAPDPAQVRPLKVLKKSLEMVKDKYRKGAEYRYLSSQMRSIRQDLTVQGIRNEFTVTVYEINARISLEMKDREEFNQCQSQLKLLYRELPGCEFEPEFVSYRLLYYVAVNDLIDINSLLQELTPELEEDKNVQFSLQVQRSVASGNYVKLFKLYEKAPRMCPFLMELFIEKERKKALNTICKAYRQTIPYKKIAKLMSMEEENLVAWMVDELNLEEAKVGGVLDCKVPRSF